MVAGAGRRGAAVRCAAGLFVMLAAAAGCTGDFGSGNGSGGSGSGGEQEQAAAVQLTIKPAADATGVAPGVPVTVTAGGVTLAGVKVAAAGGEIRGALDAGKTTWTSKTPLAFDARYTVTVEATNPTG